MTTSSDAGDFVRRELTLTNLLLLAGLLVGLGQYRTAFQTLEVRVDALQRQTEADRESSTAFRVQSNVQDYTLKNIEAQLAEIKADIKDLKVQRSPLIR